jgi:hypothetical protein
LLRDPDWKGKEKVETSVAKEEGDCQEENLDDNDFETFEIGKDMDSTFPAHNPPSPPFVVVEGLSHPLCRRQEGLAGLALVFWLL